MKKTMIMLFLALGQLYAQIQITVDWDRVENKVPETMFGLNIWDGLYPAVVNDTDYQDLIDDLDLPLVRYHASEMYKKGHKKCWIDYSSKTWDYDAVSTSLDALEGRAAQRIITIPNWPDWMKQPGNNRLDPDKYADFAQWCADMVQFLNISEQRAITYWQVLNEVEDRYKGRISELAEIYNFCAERMKQVDPAIKTGGPGLTQPWWDGNGGELVEFFRSCKNQLDFVSYHQYGGGDGTIPSRDIFNKAKSIGETTGHIRNKMSQAGLPGTTPLFLEEYNIVWSWDLDPQRKQASQVGAVFDAIVLKYAIDDGKVTGLLPWNDRDGVYGKLSQTNRKRPAYHVLYCANRFLNGYNVRTTSRKTAYILPLAVKNAGGRTLMLINRTEEKQSVSLDFKGWVPGEKVFREYSILNSLNDRQKTWPSDVDRDLVFDPLEIKFLVFGPEETGVKNRSTRRVRQSVLSLQNYPNPFNATTTLFFTLPKPANIRVTLWDMTGRMAAILYSGYRQAGDQRIPYNAQQLSSGVYICCLHTGGRIYKQKLLLIK